MRTAATPAASRGQPRPGSRRRTDGAWRGWRTDPDRRARSSRPPSWSGPPSGTSVRRPRATASPASRAATSRATASPPPAESPATAIDRALRPWSARSQRHAARTSSMAAGNGMLGGQPVLREQHPHPAGPPQPGRQLAVAAQRPELETLRRAGTAAPGPRPRPARPASGPAPRPRSPPSPAHRQAPDGGGRRARRWPGAPPACGAGMLALALLLMP